MGSIALQSEISSANLLLPCSSSLKILSGTTSFRVNLRIADFVSLFSLSIACTCCLREPNSDF